MDSLKEIWKPIEGFPEYEISNLGKVRSLKRGNCKELSLRNVGGYLGVILSNSNETYPRYVHRLVAKAFIPNPYNLLEVNHVNENKADNRASNLEWCTRQHNNSFGTRSLKASKAQKGKPSKRAVQAFIGEKVFHSFESISEANKKGFKSSALIRQCCNDPEKKYKGYHWRAVD